MFFPRLLDEINSQLLLNPSLSGLPIATKARLKEGSAFTITGIVARLPDPVETPMRVDLERIQHVHSVFSSYGMVYPPYADDAIRYTIRNSPAPMSVHLVLILKVVTEAYDARTYRNTHLLHSASHRFFLPCDLNLKDMSIEFGSMFEGRSIETVPGAIYLNEYLLPRNWNNEVFDLLSARILKEFMPECLEYKIPMNPYELARRMGLELRWVRLSEDFSVLGEVFDTTTRTSIIDAFSRRPDPDFYVEAGTILLDDRLRSGNQYPREVSFSTITHECLHWYKDRMFVALQRYFEPKTSFSICRITPSQTTNWIYAPETYDSLDLKKPSDLMEAQARTIPSHIMLNSKTGKEKVDEIIEGYGGLNEGNAYDIYREIRDFFGLSLHCVRKRLMDFGYTLPKTQNPNKQTTRFVYVEKKTPFQETEEIVYDISFDRIVTLNNPEKYPEFYKLLHSGNFIYADSRLCLSRENYIYFDSFGLPHLTEAAITSPESCCIPFKLSTPMPWELPVGAMASSSTGKPDPVEYPTTPGSALKEMDEYQAKLVIVTTIASREKGSALDFIRSEVAGKSYPEWEADSMVSKSKLKSMCTDPVRPKPKYNTFLCAMFGLKQEPYIINAMIKKWKYPDLEDLEQQSAVTVAIDSLYPYPITYIHEKLMGSGFKLISNYQSANYGTTEGAKENE